LKIFLKKCYSYCFLAKRFELFDPFQSSDHLVIDGQTLQNLEIIENSDKGTKGLYC